MKAGDLLFVEHANKFPLLIFFTHRDLLSSTPEKERSQDNLNSPINMYAFWCFVVEMTTGIVLFGDTVPDPVGQLLIVFR